MFQLSKKIMPGAKPSLVDARFDLSILLLFKIYLCYGTTILINNLLSVPTSMLGLYELHTQKIIIQGRHSVSIRQTTKLYQSVTLAGLLVATTHPRAVTVLAM